MNVTIKSWGENCGSKPKSYGSGGTVEVDVMSTGKHLVFSRGGMRTDRCVSLNPRLRSISESAAAGDWSRVCQTPKDEAKFERLESTLRAEGNDKLVYRGKSTFDWTLKGDHCMAYINERRVYIREGTSEGKLGSESSEKKGQTESHLPRPGCEEHGPLKRLSITPKNPQIGPGERVCFKVNGIDANGCRFPVSASWIAKQDDQEVGGLLSRGGCFSAGATAAESEGTYKIIARVESKTAEAEVTVAFPDLGDLLAARLKPSDGLDGPALTSDAGSALEKRSPPPADAGGTPPPQTLSTPAVATTGSSNTGLLVVVVVIGTLIAAGLLVLAIVLRRRASRASEEMEDDWLDEPLPTPPRRSRDPDLPSRSAAAPAGAPKPAQREPAQVPERQVICTKCSARFPVESRFCPHDGSSLIPAPIGSGIYPKPGSDAGMVCPKCHRGYDPGSRFCPHDSKKLIPYAEWREIHRAGKR